MKDLKNRLRDSLDIAAENDALLGQAIKRMEDERTGGAVDFFKHGQFGSHNS